MADILQNLPIKATAEKVFWAISTPEGLDQWWTQKSAGTPAIGSVYELWFGPEYDWQAKVVRSVPHTAFELEMVRADTDWMGTRVGFEMEPGSSATLLRFQHTGWPRANEHYRTSCHCWALYLRILRRYLEQGEIVTYEYRLDV